MPAKLRLALVVRGNQPAAVHELALLPVWRGRGALLVSLRLAAVALVILFSGRHRERLKFGLRNPEDVDDAVFAAAVFGFCLLVFYLAPVNQLMDGRYVTAVSYSMLHEGSLALPEVVDWNDQPEHYRLQRADGRVFHYAYTPVALLNVPFVWLYELFGISSVTSGGRFDSKAELRILKVTAAVLAAALCLVLYLLARLRLQPPAGLFLVGRVRVRIAGLQYAFQALLVAHLGGAAIGGSGSADARPALAGLTLGDGSGSIAVDDRLCGASGDGDLADGLGGAFSPVAAAGPSAHLRRNPDRRGHRGRRHRPGGLGAGTE